MSRDTQRDNNWIETSRMRTMPISLLQRETRIIVPRKERKCGICRITGHTATNCNHPNIQIMAKIIIENCKNMYLNNINYQLDPPSDIFKNYLNCLTVLHLKIVCKYLGIPVSFNKTTHINVLCLCLYDSFEREFIRNLSINYISVIITKPETTPEITELHGMCAICHDENILVNNFVKTNCSHKFCCSCVISIINYNKNKYVLNCPMCRTKITSLTCDKRHFQILSDTLHI